MTPTKIYNGQLVTSTTTEQEFEPNFVPGSGIDGDVIVQIEVVSGTIKFAVSTSKTEGAKIDGSLGTWGSYTTSNSKTLRTLVPGTNNLRAVGSGTFIISW